MGPVIPELFERSAERDRVRSAPEKRETIPVHASTWRALLSYSQRSDAILTCCFVGFVTYILKAWPDGSDINFNTATWNALVWALIVGGAVYLVYVPLALRLKISSERKEWNYGICAETGRAWQAAGRDYDSGGLKFTSESDSLVEITGIIWIPETLGYVYHHTLVLDYIRPAQ